MNRLNRRHAALLVLSGMFTLAACSSSEPTTRTFLQGTSSDPGILLAVNLDKALFMLQTGAPTVTQSVPLGASSAVTPVGFSLLGSHAIVPLGNAASVAYANLSTLTVDRYFTFPSGNATGSAVVSANNVVVCNQTTNECGRFDPAQASNEVASLKPVTAFPSSVTATAGRVFVVSSNLVNFVSVGPGVVSELNPTTMDTIRTWAIGTNPQYAAAYNGKLYVVNSGDFGSNNGTLSVIDLAANTVGAQITGFGDFPGPIYIDGQGRAFISSFNFGTEVWSAVSSSFVRDPASALCAPLSGVCRGASDATVAPNGNVYQAFFGSSAASQPAYYFVYNGTTLALTDSITVPIGPSGLTGATFGN